MRISKYLATASILVLSSAAAIAAQDLPLRDLTVEQTATAQIVAPHAGSLRATVAADRADNTYAVGESVRLMVTANADAFVTVLDIGPSGLATQLFPNRYQPDNHVFANVPVEIAGGATGARITVSPPTGTEFIKVITSNKPVTVVPETQLQGSGPFRSIDGGARALVRDLQVTADAPPSNDTLIAFNNFALYTVPSRAPTPPQTIVVVPGQPSAPFASAPHVTVPVDQPFPLLLAADKSSYRIGERATIAVTPLAPCNLTVLEFTTTGQVHTLYPLPGAPNPLEPGRTIFVSGGPAPTALQIAGPPGTEQVLAICAAVDAGAAPPPPPPPPAPNPADPSSYTRDLAVVASHPGTAMASVVFTVQP